MRRRTRKAAIVSLAIGTVVAGLAAFAINGTPAHSDIAPTSSAGPTGSTARRASTCRTAWPTTPPAARRWAPTTPAASSATSPPGGTARTASRPTWPTTSRGTEGHPHQLRLRPRGRAEPDLRRHADRGEQPGHQHDLARGRRRRDGPGVPVHRPLQPAQQVQEGQPERQDAHLGRRLGRDRRVLRRRRHPGRLRRLLPDDHDRQQHRQHGRHQHLRRLGRRVPAHSTASTASTSTTSTRPRTTTPATRSTSPRPTPVGPGSTPPTRC